jgi:hypothetical protein
MQQSWKPTVAGVLAIIAGVLNIIVALGISAFVPIAAAPRSFAILSVGAIGLFWLITGIMALIGGVFALQRRHWGVSLAGAICAIVPPSSLLGILSTVFVALAREEFAAGPDRGSPRTPELISPREPASAGAERTIPDTRATGPGAGGSNN